MKALTGTFEVSMSSQSFAKILTTRSKLGGQGRSCTALMGQSRSKNGERTPR